MSWYAGKLGLRGLQWLGLSGVALGLLTAYAFEPAQVAQAAHPPAELSESIHYTQGSFRIPFQVRPGGRSPASLDLLVSRDRGRTWHVHQTVTPAEKLFHVVDAEEGDYLVKVQARDRAAIASGRSAMRLVVDRTPPKVELLCQWQTGGILIINSSVIDDHLDPGSTKLAIRTNQSPQFRALAVEGQVDPATGRVIAATTIELEACSSFEVRYNATDLAGNQTVYSERFRHPLADDQIEVLPAHTNELEIRATEAPVGEELEIAPNDWSTIEIGKPVNAPPVHTTGFVTPSTSTATPTRLVSSRQAMEITPPLVCRVAGSPATESQEPFPAISTANTRASSLPAQMQSGALRVFSQSQRLVLAYRWDQDKPTPVRVELWCSRDGQNWSFWGEDTDRQSPCRVQVDADGDYYFRIVPIVGAADLALRPQTGDSADIVVTVASQVSPPTLVNLKPVATSGF